jgi:hypothetical protein
LDMTLNWLWWRMGFKRFAYVNFDPPNSLLKEVEPGKFTRPAGILKTEVVLTLGLKTRLKVLFSGKIHVLNVVWTTEQPNAEGDVFQFCVLPPLEKIDPKLKVREHV